MVIACNVLDVAALHTLAAFLYERHIPLLVVRAYGQLGYVRVALDEHNSCVVFMFNVFLYFSIS